MLIYLLGLIKKFQKCVTQLDLTLHCVPQCKKGSTFCSPIFEPMTVRPYLGTLSIEPTKALL